MAEFVPALAANGAMAKTALSGGEVAWGAGGLPSVGDYITDDFGDNALTGRTGQSRDAFLEPGTRYAGIALAGITRPEWTTVLGGTSLSGGTLTLESGTSTTTIATPSEMVVGAWEVDWTLLGNASTGAVNISSVAQTTSNHGAQLQDSYVSSYQNDSELDLIRDDAGADTILISASWNTDTNPHTSRTARDPFGNIEEFLDSVSKGTVSDTTYKQSKYTGVGCSQDVDCEVENVAVG